MINLPTTIKALPAGIGKEERLTQWGNALQGATHTSQLGYYGPKPPADDPPHRYHFQVFALDTQLTLPSGFNRSALLKALRGHVVAFGEIVGTYQRQTDQPPGPIAAEKK
jgi:Raf kinase inhibitor-like YbhB/YbcL family protein